MTLSTAGPQDHQPSRTPDEPDEQVAGDDRGEGEGDANLHEVGEAYLVAFLAEHADAGDVGRGADGRQVAAEGGADKETEEQEVRLGVHCGCYA